MWTRVLGAVVLALLAGQVQAQWQPLDGGGGGIPASAPSTPATPPAASGGDIPSWSNPFSGGPAAPPATPPSTPPAAAGGSGGGGIAMPGAGAPVPGGGPDAGAIEISYSGQAAADPRQATMRLTLVGNQASARVSIQGVCEQNVHLGGADLTFTGTLSGQWESMGGSIDGPWQGVDNFCGSQVPNQGQIKFFMKEGWNNTTFLHLRITGNNGTYGWNFTPTGKVYDTGGGAGAAPALVGFGGGFDSQLGRPGAGYRTGAPAPSLQGGNSYWDTMRALFLGGAINLQVGESRTQSLPGRSSSHATFDPATGRSGSSTDACTPTGTPVAVVTPGGLADASATSSNVQVRARSKGAGELVVSGAATCTRADGSRYDTRTLVVYILLVGDEAVADYRRAQGVGTPPPVSPGDIAQATVSGRTRMADNGEPVPGATVSLVSPAGGAITDPAWTTAADGSFRIVAGADKNLRSGRYEVEVQLLRQGPVPGRCAMEPGTPAGIGIDCDRWPAHRVYVDLSHDAPDADVGIVTMDFVRNIDFANRKGAEGPAPDDGAGSAGATFTNVVPYPRANPYPPAPVTDQAPAPRRRFR